MRQLHSSNGVLSLSCIAWHCIPLSENRHSPSCPSKNGSEAQVHLGSLVQDENQGTADASDNVRDETLVQAAGQTLIGCNLLEAMHGALVDMLLYRLLGLHLHATTHGVERISGAGTESDGGLSGNEGRKSAQDALVLLPRVDACDGVEGAELQSTVSDDAHHGNAKAGVKGHETARTCNSLLDAIKEATESL